MINLLKIKSKQSFILGLIMGFSMFLLLFIILAWIANCSPVTD